MKTCFQIEIGGMLITLKQRGRDNFTVQYGKQIEHNLTYGETVDELGSCIMHALACDRKLDNRQKGEK